MLDFFKMKDDQFKAFASELLQGRANVSPQMCVFQIRSACTKVSDKGSRKTTQGRRGEPRPVPFTVSSPPTPPLPRQSGAPDRTRVVSQEQMNGARKASPPRPSCRRGLFLLACRRQGRQASKKRAQNAEGTGCRLCRPRIARRETFKNIAGTIERKYYVATAGK